MSKIIRNTPSPRPASLAATVRRFLAEEAGAVAVLLVLALVPVLGAIGAAVDLSRAYAVKTRLNYALDAAGLAVGASSGDEETLLEIAQKFFAKNYPEAELGTPSSISLIIDGDHITISATASVDTTFLRWISIDQLDVDAYAEILRETKGLEVALVLDNTGSMASNGKIGQLREAASDLINILFGSQDYPEHLKVSLVPFVTAVNVGSDKTAWLTDDYDPDKFSPDSWRGCVMARDYPHDVQDTSMAVGGKWEPYRWPMEGYYRYTDSSSGGGGWGGWGWWGSGGSSTQQRSYCSNSWDVYSIDNVPSSTMGPNKSCPQPLTPLTNDKALLLSEINDMEPWSDGGTHVNLGMVWGWRVLSPEEPFTEGAEYDDLEWKKVMIVLTDGINQYVSQDSTCRQYENYIDEERQSTHSVEAWRSDNNPEGDGLNSSYTGYGYAFEGRLGTQYRSSAENALDDRVEEVCENIKDAGVILYTITFQLNDSSAQSMYRTCATDETKYFNSPSNEDLAAAFKAIAKDLSNLRLLK